jgi:hypothetical protein
MSGNTHLSPAQLRALSQVYTYAIEVGYERLSGVDRRSLEVLEWKGYVRTDGSRKVYWKITAEGKKEVTRLIQTGDLVDEG